MDFGLQGYLGIALYTTAIVALLLTIFWRPVVGLYYLLPLIPLQNIRYHLNAYPLGGTAVGIILLGIILGLLRRRQKIIIRTPWTLVLGAYLLYTFISLWMGSFNAGYPLPLPGNQRFGVWQDYMLMPALLFLTGALDLDIRHIRIMVVLMCFSTLVLDRSFWNEVSGRDYSNYTEDLRNSAESNGMGYAGSNGMAAFEAQYTTFLLALAAFEKRRLWKFGYLALAIFSMCCLAYSFSRGGYAAMLAGWFFIGLTKNRKFLAVLVLFLLTWTAWVPKAVSERVTMTYDKGEQEFDPSAETRLALWEDAMTLFHANPTFGMGFNTYAYLHRIRTYEDTHNYYVKTLVEMGVVGLALFLAFIFKIFWAAFRLFLRAKEPFFASLGLGLAGWMVAACVANFFGDRWTFLQVAGYMWVIGGFVAQAYILEQRSASAEEAVSDSPALSESQMAGAMY